MRRREFITLVGGAAAAWPIAARAQQPMPVVGFLHSQSPDGYGDIVDAFRAGLKIQGYVEGQNLAITYSWAAAQNARLPALAEDLVRRRVSVIVTAGGVLPALAAKAATTTIPIVFEFGGDPVRTGLVASMNRPGGNITGTTFITTELGPKRVGLLSELLPNVRTFAYLFDPNATITERATSDMVAAAEKTGRPMIVVEARSDRDFETAFASMVQQGAGAIVIGAYPLFINNRDKLAALAARHRVPTIYPGREFAVAGGLISYGANIFQNYRQTGVYAGQILKGTKPADLPVLQPTHFQLVINLKTARALALEIPPLLLALADEVIE